MLWNPDRLRQEGADYNKKLASDYNNYCGGTPRLDSAIAYVMLVITNKSYDPAKRDLLSDILHGRVVADGKAYQALKIQRWSPVKKAINVFSPIVRLANNPDFDELLQMQKSKAKSTTPSWGTLMPDMIYVLSKFWSQQPAEAISQMQTPFGKAVQAAFSYYSGVQINSQPTPTHHSYLHRFERIWAQAANCNVLDINSGLHRFGEMNLL